MSAIAYITDSRMLEFHRLNADKTMNFWRISTKNSFSDFGKGELLFFLSKDKNLMKGKEKGIVGFGKVESIHVASIRTMWKKYEKENGYRSYEEFLDALKKVSKQEEVPQKISSFYLTDVVYFQSPIYLSELGIRISNNIESYIYIKPEEAVLKLLEYAKTSVDIWTSDEKENNFIQQQQVKALLSIVSKRLGDIRRSERELKRAKTTMKHYLEENPDYRTISLSLCELYRYDEELTVLFYCDRNSDIRSLIGQAVLYRKVIDELSFHPLQIRFKTQDDDKRMEALLNL